MTQNLTVFWTLCHLENLAPLTQPGQLHLRWRCRCEGRPASVASSGRRMVGVPACGARTFVSSRRNLGKPAGGEEHLPFGLHPDENEPHHVQLKTEVKVSKPAEYRIVRRISL